MPPDSRPLGVGRDARIAGLETGTMTARVHALLAVALLVPGVSARAQTVRVSGSTSLRYIELRPLVRDSVASDVADGTALLRQLPDGRVVRCVPGVAYCYDMRPGDVASTVPIIQDVDVSAWGFAPGLHLHAQLRGRTALGGNRALWPREDDHLEVLSLYGEYERGTTKVRAGRQWRVSGLGFYNFDGVSVAVRRGTTTLVEAFGGRSLIRGLSDGRSGAALEAIEAGATNSTGILVGLQARYRAGARASVGATWQMDVRADREGAYAELAAADATLALGRATVDGSLEVDVAGQALNEARLGLRSGPIGPASLFAEARRYHPYFELWTIWGAFSPVGFDEVRVGASWTSAGARLILRGESSYRRYQDAATDAPDEFRTSGFGLGGTLNWRLADQWTVDGAGHVDAGFGAARRDAQLGIRRDLGGVGTATLRAVAFERLYEFRLTEGTVFGLGGETVLAAGERTRVYGAAMLYRQRGGDPRSLDWNQARLSLRVEWAAGGEPSAVPESRR